MEAINILEKRIDILTRMLGPIPEPSSSKDAEKQTESGENIIDSLLSVNSMLSSAAISERPQLKRTLERVPELEKYLDPNFLEENQQIRTKQICLNAIAPELHTQFEQLAQIKELEPTLGAEYFRNIPSDRSDKLKDIVKDGNDFAQQAELIEESLILAMKRYGELQAGILATIDAMNKRLDKVEERIETKKTELQRKDLNENKPDNIEYI